VRADTGYFIRTSNDEKDSYHLTLGGDGAGQTAGHRGGWSRLSASRQAYDLAYRNHRIDEVSRTEIRGRLIFLFRLRQGRYSF